MTARALGATTDTGMFLEIDNYSADCYRALNKPVNFPVVNVRLVAVRNGEDGSRKETHCDSGMIKLLEAIQAGRNVRVACKINGISYSRAWKLLSLLEEWAGRKMIDRHQGGMNGGGTELSKEGLEFLEKYKQFEICCKAAIQEIYDDFFRKENS
ncbi:MAG: LysR family transcriptional regulator [Spirochaetaceae bacterium]|jgi:molybdate transport repressor ModE-like protein|nr:LysR family transcriptional regulator [Spirochaetaceae bacterium]